MPRGGGMARTGILMTGILAGITWPWIGEGMAEGAGVPSRSVSAIRPAIAPERAVALTRFIRQDCGACHGITLKGGLGPDIRASALAGRTAGDLAAVILDGIPDTPMPPWRPLLSEDEALWIAGYLLASEAGAEPEEGEQP